MFTPTPLRLVTRLAPPLFAGLLLALSGGCATKDSAVMQQANQFDSGLKPAEIKDPQINAYMQQIGERIVKAAREADAAHYGPKTHFDKGQDDSWMFNPDQIQFHLVNSKTLNAFTTGGQHVYVYNALFQDCKDEDDLAAVMSHEFGHIYSRHVQKGMNRQTALMLGAGALGAAGYVAGGKEHGSEYATAGAGLGASAGQFLNMGFTRGDEAQADQMGFYFYTHAGWDPQQFDGFFKTMIAQGYDKTPAVASDHPTLASRVDAAEKRVKELPASAAQYRQPPIKDQAGFDAIKARATQLAASTPTDASLQNAKTLLQALPRSCWTPYEPDDRQDAVQQLQDKAQKKSDAKQSSQRQSHRRDDQADPYTNDPRNLGDPGSDPSGDNSRPRNGDRY